MTLSQVAYLDATIAHLEAEHEAIIDTIAACVALRHTLTDPPPPAPPQRGKRGPAKGVGRKPIRHGTNAGYAAHRRHGVPVCLACAEVHAQYVAEGKGRPGTSGVTASDVHDAMVCPHCGSHILRGGWGAHRSALHPESKARPIPPDLPPQPTVPGRVFVCDDCAWTAVRVDQLVMHVVGSHRRAPMKRERTPKEPT